MDVKALSSLFTVYLIVSSLMGSGRMFHRLRQSASVCGHCSFSLDRSPTMGSLRILLILNGRITRLYRPSDASVSSCCCLRWSLSLFDSCVTNSLTAFRTLRLYASSRRVLSRWTDQRLKLPCNKVFMASIFTWRCSS